MQMRLIESKCDFFCDEIAPVCCVSAPMEGPENGYTWKNWCWAKCGANDFADCDIRGSCHDLVIYEECVFDIAECPEKWDPVCCINSDGDYETVANECMARCKYRDTYGTDCDFTTDCGTSCCHD